MFAVYLGDFISPLTEEGLNIAESIFIEHQFCIEKLTNGLFGDVVSGRSDTPADQDQIGTVLSISQSLKDVFTLIRNYRELKHLEPNPVQLLRHPGCVGIDNLSNEDLIADVDDLDLHGTKVQKNEMLDAGC